MGKSILSLAGCATLIALNICSCKIITYKGENFCLNNDSDATLIEAAGKIDIRNYDCPEFDGLEISSIVNVIYTQGTYSLSVETYENVFDYVKFYVNESGNLVVRTQNGVGFKDLDRLVVRVSSPSLNKIILNGTAHIEFPEAVEFEEMNVRVSGVASLKSMASMKTEDFSVTMSGACELNIEKGLEASDVEIDMSGTSKCSIMRLDCNKSDIQTSGASSCTVVGSSDKASLKVSGSSTIDATQLDCGDISRKISGAGTIKTCHRQ